MKIENLRMRRVGFCGIEEVENTLSVIEDLERLSARQPKVSTKNNS